MYKHFDVSISFLFSIAFDVPIDFLFFVYFLMPLIFDYADYFRWGCQRLISRADYFLRLLLGALFDARWFLHFSLITYHFISRGAAFASFDYAFADIFAPDDFIFRRLMLERAALTGAALSSMPAAAIVAAMPRRRCGGLRRTPKRYAYADFSYRFLIAWFFFDFDAFPLFSHFIFFFFLRWCRGQPDYFDFPIRVAAASM